jgi:hypothetical protein
MVSCIILEENKEYDLRMSTQPSREIDPLQGKEDRVLVAVGRGMTSSLASIGIPPLVEVAIKRPR